MRHNVKELSHSFESVFYIGLPLVFFSLLLLYLSRRFKTPLLMVGFAGAALIVFVLSSLQMSHFYAPDATQRQKVELSDATAIRRLTAEDDLIFISPHPHLNRPAFGGLRYGTRIDYYLAQRIIHSHSLTAEGFTVRYARPLTAEGFTVINDRLETDALLTPKNERIFLYDSKKLLKAYRQAYRRIVSGELVARSTSDVYREERALHYVKTPCSDEDMKTKFFLHIFPTNRKELDSHRWLWGYNNYTFSFDKQGLRFDDTCLVSIALPHYDIARVETGPLSSDQSKERANDPDRLEVYRRTYQRVVSGELVARSTFDVYRVSRALYYVKTPLF